VGSAAATRKCKAICPGPSCTTSSSLTIKPASSSVAVDHTSTRFVYAIYGILECVFSLRARCFLFPQCCRCESILGVTFVLAHRVAETRRSETSRSQDHRNKFNSFRASSSTSCNRRPRQLLCQVAFVPQAPASFNPLDLLDHHNTFNHTVDFG